MRAFATFALAMFLSMVGAQFVAQMLAIRFGAREEFIAVMVVLGAFAVVSIAILSVVFISSGGTRPIDVAAILLVAFAVLPVLGGVLYAMAGNNWSLPAIRDLQVVAETLIPALIAVFIQWFLIRRYRSRNLE
jgi:hypothetical protein